MQGLDPLTAKNISNNLNSQDPDPAYRLYYFELYQSYPLEQIAEFFNAYVLVHQFLVNKWTYWGSHKRSRQSATFRELYGLLLRDFGEEFLANVWALQVFFVISRNDPQNHSLLANQHSFSILNGQSWTLVELVEEIYIRLSTINNLLFIKGLTTQPNLPEGLLKAVIHELIRNLSEEAPALLFSVKVEEFKNVIKPVTPQGLKKELEQTKTWVKNKNHELNYKKISTVIVHLPRKKDYVTTYWLFFHPPVLIEKDNISVVHGTYWFLAYKFLVQKKTKEETVLLKNFYKDVSTLHHVQVYPCPIMVEATSILLLEEYGSLLQDFELKLKKFKVKEDHVKNNINSLVSLLIRKKFTMQVVNSNKKTEIIEDLQTLNSEFTEKSNSFINSLFNFSEKLSSDNGDNLNATYREHWRFHNFLSEVQNFLARFRLANDALHFFDFLRKNSVEHFYYGTFVDFRGRVYYKSQQSPQAFWYYRFIFHFGKITNYKQLRNSNIVPASWLTNKCENLLLLNKLNDNNLVAVFCSIGLLFKNKLIAEETGQLSMSTAIEFGVELFLNNKDFTYRDWLQLGIKNKMLIEILYYFNIVNQCLQNNFFAYYLQKDTTCSMTQHAGKLLGYKTTALPLLNLQNLDMYFDTYQIFINELKSYLRAGGLATESVLNFLNRDLLKNLIMTTEYGVTYNTAFREFREVLKTTKLPLELVNSIGDERLFKSVYEFLKQGGLDLVFFNKSKCQWIDNFLKSNYQTFELTDIKIPIAYYKPYHNILCYRTNNTKVRERLTLQTPLALAETTQREENVTKTKNSLYVNSIHSLDAAYLRLIVRGCNIKNIPIITIHDGFCVPFYQETALRSIANVYFLENVPDYMSFDNIKGLICSTTILI